MSLFHLFQIQIILCDKNYNDIQQYYCIVILHLKKKANLKSFKSYFNISFAIEPLNQLKDDVELMQDIIFASIHLHALEFGHYCLFH